MNWNYFLPILVLVLVVILPFSARGQDTSRVVPTDTFSTPHYRIIYQPGISLENVRGVADDMEFIFGDFNSKTMLRLPKEIPTVLGASTAGWMWKYSGRIESPVFFTHDTLYVVSWNDARIPRDRMLPLLRYAISYAILSRGSTHGTPRWLMEGYSLRYANFGLQLMRPSVAYMRSFSDFSEEGQQFRSPTESEDYKYLLLKTIDFLITRYGEEKFVTLFSILPIDRTVEEGFEKAFGEKYTAIEKAWRTYIDTQVGKSGPQKGNEPQRQEK